MKKIVAIALSIFFLMAGFILAEGFVFSTVKFAEDEKVSPAQNKSELNNSIEATAVQEKPIEIILSLVEVSKHNIESDCWLVIKDKAYNVSSFVNQHPGGAKKIISECGNEVTGLFVSIHSNFAWDLLKKYYIGDINSQISPQDQKISPQSQNQIEIIPSANIEGGDKIRKSYKDYEYEEDDD